MTGAKSSPSTWVVPGNATVPQVNTLSLYPSVGGMMQFVVNSTAAGTPSNSFFWFCQAVPKLPFRWGYFFSSG